MQPGRESESTTTPWYQQPEGRKTKIKKRGSVETQWEGEERGDEVVEDKEQG